MMRCICSGHAQALPPTASSSSFLFSVDVLLDEANAPVPLGIRDGQTVMQVCICVLVFCVASVGDRTYHDAVCAVCRRG